jgi:hypothetical protein
MKTIKLSFVVMLLLGAVACRKNDYSSRSFNNGNNNVSNSEAADMVAASLSINSNGVVDIAEDVTLNAASMASGHITCGETKSDTISRQNPSGLSTTYSYSLKYNYVVNCNASSQHDSLSSSLIYSGSFSNKSLSSANSGSSIFNVSGLTGDSTNYVINGEYKRAGSFTSKTDTTSTGNNNIDIAIKALTLKKPFRIITGGNATISVTGSVPKKGNFSYTGTLVFNGDNTAALTLNGTTYKINLNTGQRY